MTSSTELHGRSHVNSPELPGADAAHLPFVSIEARRATLSLLVSVGAFESSPNGAWNFVNPQLCDMLGLPASSLLGREWIKLIHPDDVQRAVAEYRQARDGGRSWHHQLRFRRYDDTYVHVLVEANPLPQDPDEVGVSYLGVVSDVSAQHRSQEIVEEARNALQTMLDVSTEGIFVHRSGRIIAANNALARILGYDGWEELMGRDALDFVKEDDRAKFAAAAASDKAQATVGTLVRRDGSSIRVSVRSTPAVYAGADARISSVVAIDSPHVLAMSVEQMRRQLQVLEDVLTLPYSRVQEIDGRVVFVGVNQAYADFVGRSRAQLLGAELTSVFAPDTDPSAYREIERFRQVGQQSPSELTVTYLRPDGTKPVAKVYAVNFRDPVTGESSSAAFVVPV